MHIQLVRQSNECWIYQYNVIHSALLHQKIKIDREDIFDRFFKMYTVEACPNAPLEVGSQITEKFQVDQIFHWVKLSQDQLPYL